MPANRLQALLGPSSISSESKQAASFGFLVCPVSLLGNFATPYQLFIQELYRIARAGIEAPARPGFRLPEFSRN